MSRGFLDSKTISAEEYRRKLFYQARWSGKQNRFQRALVGFLLKSKPKFYLTKHYNRPVKDGYAVSREKEFFGRLDRWLLGRDFYKSTNRTRGFLVFENLTTNMHSHCGISFPKGTHFDLEIESFMKREWAELEPRGGLDLREITQTPEILVGYTLKQIYSPDQMDRIHWLDEFWPANL